MRGRSSQEPSRYWHVPFAVATLLLLWVPTRLAWISAHQLDYPPDAAGTAFDSASSWIARFWLLAALFEIYVLWARPRITWRNAGGVLRVLRLLMTLILVLAFLGIAWIEFLHSIHLGVG